MAPGDGCESWARRTKEIKNQVESFNITSLDDAARAFKEQEKKIQFLMNNFDAWRNIVKEEQQKFTDLKNSMDVKITDIKSKVDNFELKF